MTVADKRRRPRGVISGCRVRTGHVFSVFGHWEIAFLFLGVKRRRVERVMVIVIGLVALQFFGSSSPD